MYRYKYWICSRDLIDIAQGRMRHVEWYPRKPKECLDATCDLKSFVEVYINIEDPIKSGKSKSPKSNMESLPAKRQASRKKIR